MQDVMDIDVLALYVFSRQQIEVALCCYATVVGFSSDVFAFHIVITDITTVLKW